MSRYSVYFLIGCSGIFYVGITNNPRRRMNEHRKQARDGNKNMTYSKWRSMVNKGKEVKMVVCAASLEKSVAQNLEKLLVKFYGRRDNGSGILTNHSDGGEGSVGWIATPEFRELRRKAMLGKKINLGKARPDNAEKFSKPVIVTMLDTGEVKEYSSQRIAAKDLGVHYDTVNRYVNKKAKYDTLKTKKGVVSFKHKGDKE